MAAALESEVEVVAYRAEHGPAFCALNRAWLDAFWASYAERFRPTIRMKQQTSRWN